MGFSIQDYMSKNKIKLGEVEREIGSNPMIKVITIFVKLTMKSKLMMMGS